MSAVIRMTTLWASRTEALGNELRPRPAPQVPGPVLLFSASSAPPREMVFLPSKREATHQAQRIDALKTHKKGLMQGLFPKLEEGVTRRRGVRGGESMSVGLEMVPFPIPQMSPSGREHHPKTVPPPPRPYDLHSAPPRETSCFGTSPW